MNEPVVNAKARFFTLASIQSHGLLRALFAGLLIPFGFAPFHIPGFMLLGIALLFAQLNKASLKDAFLTGFIFGLGFLGLGVSWVYVSIHTYGHLNMALSVLITLLFITYLALFPAMMALVYRTLVKQSSALGACLLFSALWCLNEYLRSRLMSGFPWLLLGFGQVDTPLRYLLPIIGVYGVSFLCCFAATCLVMAMQSAQKKRVAWLATFISVLIIPALLQHQQWTRVLPSPLSVGVIQANLSMRDKWNEALFWQLVEQYKQQFDLLVGKKKLIVMPESAIPIPAHYVSDIIDTFHQEALQANSALLLGIPQATNSEETHYYNTIMSLGHAEGHYVKQHLVPFGEYIPKPFQRVMQWLSLPSSNLKPGQKKQALIVIDGHPVASLICYELAYPELLRQQLPEAQWIVSISDDGWFGHSLAMYQQLQMAQVLSLQTGRFQVVSNNDGLSSMIDTQGNITASLAAFSAGLLEADVYPATGMTPWARVGDWPILCFSLLILLCVLYRHTKKGLSI